MKQLFLFLILTSSLFAEELPLASEILAFARRQLPLNPVEMVGTLKERAANGFVKQTLFIEMELDWGAVPSTARYRISDAKKKSFQVLEIQWMEEGPVFQWLENDIPKEIFDPNSEINGLGITWADLSFSFLWSKDAKTLREAKKLGRECFVISVPRPQNHQLLLWIEKKNGLLLEAEERDAEGTRIKIIDVVGVKKFGNLWMVKDLNIIRFPGGEKTSLKIETVDVRS